MKAFKRQDDCGIEDRYRAYAATAGGSWWDAEVTW